MSLAEAELSLSASEPEPGGIAGLQEEETDADIVHLPLCAPLLFVATLRTTLSTEAFISTGRSSEMPVSPACLALRV